MIQIDVGRPSELVSGRRWTRDWGNLLTLCAVIYTVIYGLWLVFDWGGDTYRTLIGNVAGLLNMAMLLAVAWRAATYHRLDQLTRRAWHLLSLSFLMTLIGHVLYFYYDIALTAAPFPSVADVAYLIAYPLLLWGVLTFPVPSTRNEDRLTFWLDATTVLVGGGMVIWHVFLGPAAMGAYASWLEAVLSVAYPVADLILLFGAAAVALRRPLAASRTALLFLLLGMLANTIADVAYGALSLQGTYDVGMWPDAFWAIGTLMYICSAQVQYWSAATHTDDSPNTQEPLRSLRLLPYLSVGVGYGLLVVVARNQWNTPVGSLIVGAVVLTGLVLMRQVLAVRTSDQSRMAAEAATMALEQANTQLEQRVVERTAALSAALTVQEGQARELQASLHVQERLNATIATLSVPIIPIHDDVLVVPLVGTIDADRARTLLENVLHRVELTRARYVFLDITGLTMVDRPIAQALVTTAMATRLLGAETRLVGLRPEVAHVLVTLDAPLGQLRTSATLQAGLAELAT